MGAFPSGQWGQTVNLLLNASVVRIHQLPPKACDKKDVTGFFLCCIVENWRFRQLIFELLFIKMSSGFQTVGHFYCLIFPQNSELWQGRGQFFWEKQNKSCCFQNVFNFLAANFLLAAGIFRFFQQFSVCFQVFHFTPIYNKENFHYEHHYRYRPRLLRSLIQQMVRARRWRRALS